MSNCEKKATQILVEENEELDNFKIYEKNGNEAILLGEFTSPEEVEVFFHKLELERQNENIILRFI